MNRKPFRATLLGLLVVVAFAWLLCPLGSSNMVMADGGGADPPWELNPGDTTVQGSGEACEDDDAFISDAVEIILELIF